MKSVILFVGVVVGCAAVIAADFVAVLRDYQRGMFYE